MPQAGYSIYTIAARGFSGKGLIGKMLFFPTLLVGLLQSLVIFVRFKPDVAVGTGGYLSVPLVLAAGLSGVPVALLALDALPSKAVRSLARWATEIHLSFPESKEYFSKGQQKKLTVSGNPVRDWVLKGVKSEACRHFGLDDAKKILLIIGGSQGAHSLNVAMGETLGLLKEIRPQILWQTGEKDLTEAERKAKEYPEKAVVRPFFEEMDKVYAATDLAVGRSGATATAELMDCGIPCILIPYPYAAENHQEKNARWYESKGAAKVILNRELNGSVLAREITRLFEEPERLKEMAQNARACGQLEAAKKITDSLERLLERGKRV